MTESGSGHCILNPQHCTDPRSALNQKSGCLAAIWKYMTKLTCPRLTLNTTTAAPVVYSPGTRLQSQQYLPPSWCIPKPAKLSLTPGILFIEAPSGIMYQIKVSLLSFWFLRAIALINHPVPQAGATSHYVSLPTPKLEVPSPAVPLPLRAVRATGSTDPLGTSWPWALGLSLNAKRWSFPFCPVSSRGTWGCSCC